MENATQALVAGSARKLWHVVAKGMYSSKGCRFCFTPAG